MVTFAVIRATIDEMTTASPTCRSAIESPMRTSIPVKGLFAKQTCSKTMHFISKLIFFHQIKEANYICYFTSILQKSTYIKIIGYFALQIFFLI